MHRFHNFYWTFKLDLFSYCTSTEIFNTNKGVTQPSHSFFDYYSSVKHRKNVCVWREGGAHFVSFIVTSVFLVYVTNLFFSLKHFFQKGRETNKRKLGHTMRSLQILPVVSLASATRHKGLFSKKVYSACGFTLMVFCFANRS